jgi:hypothetical protein
VKLHSIAYSRCGDKGDMSNVAVFPYDDADWEMLRERLTVDVVAAKFGDLVKGPIERFEFDGIKCLNFVMRQALAGGVSISLRIDPHGKSYQSLILDIEV